MSKRTTQRAQPAPLEAVLSLHRYFIWADRFRWHFDQAIAEVAKQPSKPTNTNALFVENLGLYMSFWYSGLHVVVEGYEELKLSDPKVDALLNSPNKQLLKRYRHGVCHFQKTYFDARFNEFMEEHGTPSWVRGLHVELGRVIRAELDRRRT